MNTIYIISYLLLVIYVLFPNRLTERFDNICGKYELNRIEIWQRTKKKYGEMEAIRIFPRTFLLPRQIKDLMKEPSDQFILKKKWGSLRRGCDLFNNKDEIKKNMHKYDIAQVFIKNPLLINGFKFDIRVYLVVVCGYGIFLYRNGYNDYTKEKFDYTSMDRDKKINQCFCPDSQYSEHSLPKYADEIQGIDVVWPKLVEKLKKVLDSTKDLCCDNDTGNYNIYGIDVELLDNLDPMIIEINSTPSDDTGWKAEFKSKVKKYVQDKDFSDPKWIRIK